jgi:hypothetical protein
VAPTNYGFGWGKGRHVIKTTTYTGELVRALEKHQRRVDRDRLERILEQRHAGELTSWTSDPNKRRMAKADLRTDRGR